MILAIILIISAYLLGSIPFALVIGKGLYGVDVRERGSGNIGTTNVFRVLGSKAGLLVFAGDLVKGFLPVIISINAVSSDNAALVTVLVAAAAIAGHNWSIFLKGKGGKGVATGGGVILAMMPWLFLLAFAIFWLVLVVDRRVSVASLSAATGLSAATLVTGKPLAYIVFTLLGTAIVFYAHRSNIQRISRGEESRVAMPWSRGGRRRRRGGGVPVPRDDEAAREKVTPGSEAAEEKAAPEDEAATAEEAPRPEISPESFDWEEPTE